MPPETQERPGMGTGATQSNQAGGLKLGFTLPDTTDDPPYVIVAAKRFRDAVADWPHEVAPVVVESVCAKTGLPATSQMLTDAERRLAAGMLDHVHALSAAIARLIGGPR